ncbi:hypothetical protein S7711_09928 [Stachybotrys chartarum IBT 7711]|uniref:Apple domain-containing protein n=1 Tax=Stachybotrys chartarum (strain CBS 109288 / IBT 7711) TaxID=1280523 RepID=A0A084AJQ6_STACB|nr:hypothetical protein S7711_09928 [Stachybotrys chartarum IBT 7711]
MRIKTTFVLSALLGAAGSNANVCNADNCLRAIRNPAKPGIADCSSYLKSTSTPPEEIVTEYATESVVAIETESVTETLVFYETTTEVIPATATQTLPGSTTTVTVFDPALRKRSAAPTLPAYATPCSGEARYTSACSCIGVTGPIIVTAPTPTTTITLPTTVTYSTETVTVTVATESTTVIAATTSVTTTLSTVTLTGPAATVTQNAPFPPECRNIVLYNGLQPVDFSPLTTHPRGILSTDNCCLACFQLGGCVAYVVNYNGPGSCLLLSVRDGSYDGNPTGQCPLGKSSTIFGNAGGSVGKGPCQKP